MALNCLQVLSGLAKDCGPNKGGIKTIYIANYDDISAVTLGDDTITAITMANSAKFKQYHFRPETGSMTSTLTVDQKTGSNFVTTDISLVFTKMDTTKRIEIAALSLGDLAVIVEDENGVFWYVGKDRAVMASAGSANTGTARADGSNYSITLQSVEDTYPYEVSASVIEGLIA